MPLRLRVGVTRKIGLPSFSSIGASCQIEVELPMEAGVLETDLDGFHRQVRTAYIAAHQAVHDELARLHPATHPPPAPPRIEINPPGPAGNRDSRAPISPTSPARPDRPATLQQLKAIRALACRGGLDLEGWLRDLHVDQPENLTIAQASRLIDRLKTDDPGQ